MIFSWQYILILQYVRYDQLISSLKLRTVGSFKMMVRTYMTTRNHILKEHSLNFRINFCKFHVAKAFLVKPVVDGVMAIS